VAASTWYESMSAGLLLSGNTASRGTPEVVVAGYFLLAEKIQRQAFILEFPKLKNREKGVVLTL